MEELTKRVIEAQSSQVDVVAGATYTSEGFLEAVNNATGK
ncbi:MAG: FMN-binding protein [Cetobacterium sp.]